MRGQLTFNDINLTQAFGVYVSGSGTFGAPARDVTFLTVPGRSGQLTMDNGSFQNILVTYPCFIARDFSENIEHLRSFLLSSAGYKALSDTYHPDEYRMGAFVGPIAPTVDRDLGRGSFDLVFNCMPQRFLKPCPAQTFTESGYIYNPELMPSRPLIRVYGTGRITINGTNIWVNTNTEYTDIDCEMMDAYEGTVNRNADIRIGGTGDFPTLGPGSNRVFIASDASITSVVITPRWWRI